MHDQENERYFDGMRCGNCGIEYCAEFSSATHKNSFCNRDCEDCIFQADAEFQSQSVTDASNTDLFFQR